MQTVVVVVVVVDSHIQRFVLATGENTNNNTVIQQVKSAIDLSNDNPARRSTGHIMVTTRYSDQQGSKSLKKILARSNQPRTMESYRRQDYVFEYELQFLLSGVLPVLQNLNYNLQRRLSDGSPYLQFKTANSTVQFNYRLQNHTFRNPFCSSCCRVCALCGPEFKIMGLYITANPTQPDQYR